MLYGVAARPCYSATLTADPNQESAIIAQQLARAVFSPAGEPLTFEVQPEMVEEHIDWTEPMEFRFEKQHDGTTVVLWFRVPVRRRWTMVRRGERLGSSRPDYIWWQELPPGESAEELRSVGYEVVEMEERA